MTNDRPSGDAAAPGAMLRSIGRRAVRIRSDLFFAGQDACLVAVSFGCILLVRFGGQVPAREWSGYLTFLPVAAAVYLACHATAGLYGQIWRFASVLEARRLLLAGVAALVVLFALDVVGIDFVPRSVLVAGCLFTTMLVGTARFGARLFSSRRRDDIPDGLRVVVVGAGDTGAALIREMKDNPRSGLTPVALIDDDVRKQGRTILGVRVMGTVSELATVCGTTRAHQVVLAIPSVPARTVRELAAVAHEADVVMRVLPTSYDPVVGALRLQDMRDLEIEDLLGRQEVRTDLEAVHSLVSGRRVLVTGAGGSIGSEIALQVAALEPAELLLLDHDETHLYDVVQALDNRPGPAAEEYVATLLADIRERDLVLRLLRDHRPDVVFHAAAHKHVPMLEAHPAEAVRTNVLGTANLLAACRATDVPTFVFISTDKAVRPSSVMGASKHLAEQLVLASGREAGGAYCAVRFGNVLGSRGSVIPTFMRQIRAGGPVTVTDARMTRFFMSTREAVQLVLQAAAMAQRGEVFMLEMGEPVEILDLAKRMIRMAGRRVGEDVEVRVIGARPGEKLEEQLWLPEEAPEPTRHPAVVRLHPQLAPDRALARATTVLSRLADAGEDELVRNALFEMADAAAGWSTDRTDAVQVVDIRDSASERSLR
jgi:FlaA1/EpsC-like NDP-sugar epimerase